MTMTVKELKEALDKLPEELDDTPIYQYNGLEEGSDTIGCIKVLNNIEDRKNCCLSHRGDPAWIDDMVKADDGKYYPPFPLVLVY